MAKAASQLRRVRNTPKGPRGDRPVRGVTARGPCLEGKYSTGGIEALREASRRPKTKVGTRLKRPNRGVIYSTPMTGNRPELSGSGRSCLMTNNLVAQEETSSNRNSPDL